MTTPQFSNGRFENALADYFYLIDRGYPEKGSLKLVGDKYKLETTQRTVLYRGVCSSVKSFSREQKLTHEIHEPLIVDGYNVIFTILNYRLGRFVFLSTDSVCRDAGSLFGKIRKEKLFGECAELLANAIKHMGQPRTIIYFDSPVSFSKQHRSLMDELLSVQNIDHEVNIVHSADGAIKEHISGTLATSDSVLIDASHNPVIDLSRKIIEENYDTTLFSLKQKLEQVLAKKDNLNDPTVY